MGQIQYPIQVNKINFGKCEPVREGWSCKTGTMVRVRPCGEKYQDKTYLGIYLGDIALSQIARYNEKKQELEVGLSMHNPAMFVPELNEIRLFAV